MYFQPFTSCELIVKTCDKPAPETGVRVPPGGWELAGNVVYVKTCCHPEFCPAASVAYPYTPMVPTNDGSNVIFGLTVIVLPAMLTLVLTASRVHWPLLSGAPLPGALGPSQPAPSMARYR